LRHWAASACTGQTDLHHAFILVNVDEFDAAAVSLQCWADLIDDFFDFFLHLVS